MSLIFTVIGDSNIKRHLNPMNCRDRPLMTGAQSLSCGRLEVLAESLKQVRKESNVVVFSCVTNFLTRSEGSSTVTLRVEPVLIDFLAKVEAFCSERPELRCLVCPPMYRSEPLWYRDSLPQILTKFSEVFSRRPDAVLLMPSFPTPVLEDDGVHLTAYSGLEFVLHLFDSACAVIKTQSFDLESKSAVTSEATRVIEDRLMAVEQDHQRLNRFVEYKTAVYAEMADYNENVRYENWFVILGLRKLDPDLEKKEWQRLAKIDVNEVLNTLMGKEYPIVVVQNITSKGKDAICRYQVLMTSIADSKEIRDTFGDFFTGGKGDTRPEALKKLSIRNRITPATQVRIAIMKLQAKRYMASNPEGKAAVIGYEPRPVIKIFPPPDASDQRIRTFNYIEAVKNLPTNFPKSEIDPILEKINSKLRGQLRSLFVVISDDMLPQRSVRAQAGSGGAGGSRGSGRSGSRAGRSGSKPGRNSLKRGPSTSPSGSGTAAKSTKQ